MNAIIVSLHARTDPDERPELTVVSEPGDFRFYPRLSRLSLACAYQGPCNPAR